MTEKKSLTFAIMDAPFEQARTTTAFRLIDVAVRRGHDVTVFCYEGAVSLSFAKQVPHANGVHGRTVEEEGHPTTREWVAALLKLAEEKGSKLTWINCGLCVDERGANESIPGTVRGSPGDLWKAALASTNTLVIPTK